MTTHRRIEASWTGHLTERPERSNAQRKGDHHYLGSLTTKRYRTSRGEQTKSLVIRGQIKRVKLRRR
jgi:hypothetical protein